MPVCFYVLGAFLPSVPGRARNMDPLIKKSPVRAWAMPRPVERPPASDGAVVAREARIRLSATSVFVSIRNVSRLNGMLLRTERYRAVSSKYGGPERPA